MSPRFQPDLSAVSATTPIYDRGDYEVEITKSTPFAYLKEDEDTGAEYTVAGCRYTLRMIGPVNPNTGATDENSDIAEQDVVPYSVYVHTKKAFAFTKRVLMAMLGYTRDEEELANNEFFSDAELWIEGGESEDDEVEAGDDWARPVGNRVIVTLDKDVYEGNEQQRFRSWRPISK